MTYEELLAELQNLTPEQLRDDATVLLGHENEYCRIHGFHIEREDDVLHAGHAVMVVNEVTSPLGHEPVE